MTLVQNDEQLCRDLDSLHVLPLVTLSLKTPTLRRARLIKDARLNTVVSMFNSKETGAGVLDLIHLTPESLDVPRDDLNSDLSVLGPISHLFSFDVYSLRICLRHLGVPVAVDDLLKLSPGKQVELREHMRSFTLPLIKNIYGSTEVEIKELSDIIKLFSNPDVELARHNLEKFSRRLAVKVEDIPKFLEDFSDIYLSLAYYKQHLDLIAPKIENFVDDMRELRKNWQLSQDARAIETFSALELNLNNLVAGITGRFESFSRNTDNLWHDINAEKFKAVQELIKSHQATIGGVLCGLYTKMSTWHATFPTSEAGGPLRRSEVILCDIAHGIGKIVALEKGAINVVDHLRTLRENAKPKAESNSADREIALPQASKESPPVAGAKMGAPAPTALPKAA
jgi:hypothetical protein